MFMAYNGGATAATVDTIQKAGNSNAVGVGFMHLRHVCCAEICNYHGIKRVISWKWDMLGTAVGSSWDAVLDIWEGISSNNDSIFRNDWQIAG